jgi:signal transduction histidine kinase
VTAYRIIQEALTNARRHGDARRARVLLTREEGWLHLTVQDWGRGFDAGRLADTSGVDPQQGRQAGHHVGLHSMRERAHLLGGTFELESAPGEGTTVHASIPVHEGSAQPSRIAGYWDNLSSDASMETGGAVGAWPSGDADPANGTALLSTEHP